MGSFIPWNENPINIPRIPPTFPSNCNPDMTCCSVLTVLNRVFDMNPLVDSGNPNWIKTVNLEPWEEVASRVFSTWNSVKLQDFLQCLSWSFIIPSSSRWTHRRASELLSFSAWPEIFHYWPNSCIYRETKIAGQKFLRQKIRWADNPRPENSKVEYFGSWDPKIHSKTKKLEQVTHVLRSLD